MESRPPTMKPLFWLTLAVTTLAAAHEPPQFRLGDIAEPKAYEVQLAVDPREESFAAEIRIDMAFKDPTPVLWLNATKLSIESAEFRQGGRLIRAKVLEGGEDFVGFEPEGEPFAAGPATATIRYRGLIDGVSSRGVYRHPEQDEWYVITQFE